MGLDMMLIAKKNPEDQSSDENRIFYWRKHPNLHGWMENLYRSRGGSEESFNCIEVELTNEDLDRLERDVLEDRLPETSGFFFGKSYPEDKERDLEGIKVARSEIKDGLHVYYDSWW